VKPTMSVKRTVTCLRSASTRASKTAESRNLAQRNKPQTLRDVSVLARRDLLHRHAISVGNGT